MKTSLSQSQTMKTEVWLHLPAHLNLPADSKIKVRMHLPAHAFQWTWQLFSCLLTLSVHCRIKQWRQKCYCTYPHIWTYPQIRRSKWECTYPHIRFNEHDSSFLVSSLCLSTDHHAVEKISTKSDPKSHAPPTKTVGQSENAPTRIFILMNMTPFFHSPPFVHWSPHSRQ